VLRLSRAIGGIGVAGALCLAAAPTFAVMALLSAVSDAGVQDVICSAAGGHTGLGGMTTMYALMSAFHAVPWFRLIRGGDGGGRV